MLAGGNLSEFKADLRYNADPSVLHAIAENFSKIEKRRYSNEMRKASEEEADKAYDEAAVFTSGNLASMYYAMKKGFVEDGQFSSMEAQNAYGKQGMELLDAFARMYAGSEKDPFEKINDFLNNYTQYFTTENPPNEQEIEYIMESMNTFDDEEDPEMDWMEDQAPMVDQCFVELLNWLDSIKKIESQEKKFEQIEKISDLQKVAASEFARPKALFIKKLINRDFWIRKPAPTERSLYSVCDKSGSMQDFVAERNKALTFIYETCNSKDIKMFNASFNCNLNKDEKEIKTEDDLKQILKVRPDGSDNLGRSTIQKLNEIGRMGRKQYLIMISDGTGSFESDEQSEKAKELAAAKNVEVKYVLFSNANEMHTIPKEDIFYIYDAGMDLYDEDDD